jgi:hypothetical protein
MNETTTILISAIVALSGVVVYMARIFLKELKDNTRALDRNREAMNRVEELLKNWRAR